MTIQTTKTTAAAGGPADLHPVELLLLAALITAAALLELITAASLLWKPHPPLGPLALSPSPAPLVPELQSLTVRELRQTAHHLGLPRSLSRSGRRADLLAALPMAW